MNKTSILTVFFASILIFIFLTLPAFEIFLKEKRKMDYKKEELNTQERYFEEIRKVSSDLEKKSRELGMIDLAISDEFITPSLIRYLEKSSQNNGLFFDNFKSFLKKESEKIPKLGELELSFSVSGSYLNFKNFIKTLEDSIKVIEVKNFSILSDLEEEEQKNVFFYDVTIKTYLY